LFHSDDYYQRLINELAHNTIPNDSRGDMARQKDARPLVMKFGGQRARPSVKHRVAEGPGLQESTGWPEGQAFGGELGCRRTGLK
jgi:hypothetical protein